MLIALTPAWAAKDIGDAAPSLTIREWLKGQPVDLAAGKGKNIFVLEFWATWCGPCRANIPHLTELQRKYKDKGVVVMGITAEDSEVVKPFVNQMGDKMDYTIAVDDRVTTTRDYMQAFGAEGIPYAAVIDKNGIIAWHGHPANGMDAVIERLVTGKYDLQVAKDEAQATRLMEDYFQTVAKWNATKNATERERLDKHARETGDAILAKAAKSTDLLGEFAMSIMVSPGTEYRDLDLAARAGDASFKASEQTTNAKARKFVLDYFLTAQAANAPATSQPAATRPAADAKAKLSELGDALIKTRESTVLDAFAWALLTATALKDPDVNLALRAAETANEVTGGKDPSVLDTYALALFKAGQRDKAIVSIKKALEVNTDPRLTDHLQQSLARYQAGVGGRP
jgi:thiol-disulfide isomerase/thioredoxin